MDRLGLLLLVVGLAGLLLVDDRGVQFGGMLACMLPASAGWLVLVHGACTGRFRPRLGQALLVAVALRALLVATPPQLSTDLHRYVFEGDLVLHGENPYLHPPMDAAWLEYLGRPGSAAYGNWRRINHPEVPAAYPPAAQFAMAAGVWLAPGALGQKLIFGCLDLCVFLALWGALRRIGMPPARAIVQGFCPVLILEHAGEGHSDSLAALGLVVAVGLGAGTFRRQILSGAALAVGVTAKFLPAVAWPFIGWPKAGGFRLPFTAALVGVVLALYLPFLAPLDEMFQGTHQYYARWSHNGSVFPMWQAVTEWFRMWVGLDGGGYDEWAKRLIRVPIVLLGLWVLLRAWRRALPAHTALLWFFVFWLAFTPTLHPWYLALLVPWLAFRPVPGLLVFCGTVLLSYHVLPAYLLAERAGDPEPPWQESIGWLLVEYAPFYIGVAQLLRGWDTGGRDD